MTDLLELIAAPRFLLVASAAVVAGFLRGFVGFGGALVMVPVLSVAFGPLAAVPISNLAALPATFQLLPAAVRHAERPIVVPIALAIFAAAPIGSWILVSTDPAIMKIVISALVLLMVGMLARGWRLHGNVDIAVLVAAGAAGGLIQGSAGIGGPPVVAVALSRPGAAEKQRGNVLGVMTAIPLASLLPLWYYGLFTEQVVLIALLLFPLYSASTWIGARYFSGRGRRHFRTMALILLAAVGAATLLASVRGYLLAA